MAPNELPQTGATFISGGKQKLTRFGYLDSTRMMISGADAVSDLLFISPRNP